MIKPCPFCNGVSYTDRTTWSDGSFCYIRFCSKCGNSTKAYSTEREAIDAWNNRPREDELLNNLKYSKIAIESLLNALQVDSAYDTDVMRIIEVVKKYEGENEKENN
jgi:hypothetical protein